MNCWKTINLSKDYGFHRLFFLSIITSVFAFILLFLFLQFIFSTNKLEDTGLFYFIICAALLFPIHQIIHIIVLGMLRKKIQFQTKKKWFIPIIRVKHCQLLSKNVAILTIFSPLFLVTSILLVLSTNYPSYIHYFSILAAVNIGICVTDLLYGYQFLKAPKQCYMEEVNGGYDILIQK
jgi:hypothetical protein